MTRGDSKHALVVAAVAVVLVAGLWLALPEQTPASPTPGFAAASGAEPIARMAEMESEPQARDLRTLAADRPLSISAVAAPRSASNSHRVQLVGRFVSPIHSDLEVERAEVLVLDAHGSVRRTIASHAKRVVVTDLAPGEHRVRVVAAGYEHREQLVKLGVSPPEERIILWPRDWVAVLVTTPEGRPPEALAADLGIEPAQRLVDAFTVRLRSGGEDATPPVTWHTPPESRPDAFPEECIGWLEGRDVPPFRVGLGLLGEPLDEQFVRSGDLEVRFVLDAATLERSPSARRLCKEQDELRRLFDTR